MSWCPKCKTEYRPGFETCADCGEPLLADGPVQASDPNAQVSSYLGSVGAGCLAGFLSWMCFLLLLGIVLSSSCCGFDARRLCIAPLVCSITAFLTGTCTGPRPMASSIGWLIASTPFLCMIGLGYAHSEPTPIAQANLIQCAILSPLLIGPLSLVAGTRFARAPKWANLALWLVPTGVTVLALLIAGSIVARVK